MTELHAACGVSDARYLETGKRGLGRGVHCPSVSSLSNVLLRPELLLFFLVIACWNHFMWCLTVMSVVMTVS